MNKLTHIYEEVQLVYYNKTNVEDRPNVKNPREAFEIFRNSWDTSQIDLVEESKILLLDNNLRLMSIASISKGGVSETIVDPRVIFSIALKRRAQSIILAHNHPSGSLKPSRSDILLTEMFILAGRTLKIPLDDHLIISKDKYCSLFSEGFIDDSLLEDPNYGVPMVAR